MFDNNFGKRELISKFFCQVIRKKILYVYISQKFPPNLQYVAKLPCEKSKIQKCYTWTPPSGKIVVPEASTLPHLIVYLISTF